MLRYFTCFCVLLLLPELGLARWIDDIARIENPAIGTVNFSHYAHLEALGKNCVFCHNRVFNIDPAKNQPISMAEMEKGQSCGACHNGQKAFSVSENCSSCHPTTDINFSVAEGNALFSHELHSDIYSCSDCHPDIFLPDRSQRPVLSMDEMVDGRSCGACHDGDTAFSVEDNCDSCHDM